MTASWSTCSIHRNTERLRGMESSSSPVKISEDGPVIEVQGIMAIGGDVLSMTSTPDETIVISGYVPDQQSHITVINRQGEVIRQDKFKKVGGQKFRPYRRCDFLSQHIVATMCESGQIGLYDVCNGEYTEKDTGDVIKNAISDWSPDDMYISCISADRNRGKVFIGTKSTSAARLISREVLVFDKELNFLHTLLLPDALRGSRALVVHGRTLVVCDHCSRNAYLVSMEGPESELIRRFPKPDQDGADWIPYKVCLDSRGYVYMRWESWGSDDWRAVLTQHIPDGSQLLATIPVDGYSDAMCTLKTDEGGEKLMLVTKKSAKMYTFSLTN